MCDEPTDVDTKPLLQPYLQDERVHFFQNEKRLGIGGNWNACLEKAQAQYVQFLFQDDTWEPQYLEKTIRIMEREPHVGIIAVGHRYKKHGNTLALPFFEALQKYKKEHIAPGKHKGTDLLKWWINRGIHPNIVGEPSFVMLRRSLTEEVGPFHEELPQFLDVEYWLRCLERMDIFFIEEELGDFRVHSAGASAQNYESGVGIYDRLICLNQLVSRLRGPLKKEAKKARKKALVGMIRKFLDRRKSGKSTPSKGSGNFSMQTFALSHPFLIASAFWQVLAKSK